MAAVIPDLTDAIAVKIHAPTLGETAEGDEFWLVFNEEKFDRTGGDEGLARYYPDEMIFLSEKTGAELGMIHRMKKAVKGTRVRK